jgi:hypothetical protein
VLLPLLVFIVLLPLLVFIIDFVVLPPPFSSSLSASLSASDISLDIFDDAGRVSYFLRFWNVGVRIGGNVFAGRESGLFIQFAILTRSFSSASGQFTL